MPFQPGFVGAASVLEAARARSAKGDLKLRTVLAQEASSCPDINVNTRCEKPSICGLSTPAKRAMKRPCSLLGSIDDNNADTNLDDKLRKSLVYLRSALAVLPRDSRQEVLESAPEKVRHKLLTLMLSQEVRLSDTTTSLDIVRSGSQSDTESSDLESAGFDEEVTMRSLSDQTTSVNQAAYDEIHARSTRRTAEPLSTKVRGTKSGHRGIIQAVAGGKYGASAVFRHLTVFTCYVKNVEIATQFRAMLVDVQHAINNRSYQTRQDLGSHIRDTIARVCMEAGVCQEDFKLVFRTQVSTSSLISDKQKTVASPFSSDLDWVLEWRERLLHAKAMGWDHFRVVWISMMQSVAPRTLVWGGGYNQPKTAEEAAAIADEAYEAGREMRERKARARASHAISLVGSVLRAQDRALELEKKKLQARRQALWRWERDPRRTTEEILCGRRKWRKLL